MDKLLMRPMEAAEALGIGRSLVYEMLARKELPSIRIGRCIRIPANALEKWIEDQENGE